MNAMQKQHRSLLDLEIHRSQVAPLLGALSNLISYVVTKVGKADSGQIQPTAVKSYKSELASGQP